jgi:hypothetical protein
MSLSQRIVHTLMRGGDLHMIALKGQHSEDDIKEQCHPLISNGMISLKEDVLYMTQKQISTAKLIFDFKK